MAQTTNAAGYPTCCLSVGGKAKSMLIHSLVLRSFVSERPEGMECRHLDGNPANNTLGNLRWGTRKQNITDKIDHGTNSDRYGPKLKWSDVKTIRWAVSEKHCSYAQIAAIYGVSTQTVSSIMTNRTWSV